MKKVLATGLVLTAAGLLSPAIAEARDRLLIVGSSTVFPFATVVAENVALEGLKHPVVESTGSGAGFKLFCKGTGTGTPDITNASRRIKASELETCLANGVTPVEVKIGYDGIVLANSKRGVRFSLSVDQIFKALAEKLPVDGKVQDNPNSRWSEIDPALPDEKIEVLGPPPTSGTRDAFEELVMEKGCEAFPELEGDTCTSLRRDSVFIEAGEDDDLIAGALLANPGTLGIFGYSFLVKNQDRIQGLTVDEVGPTFDNISSGQYPVSRPLYFYIKKEHVGEIPGLETYIEEFVSEKAWGDEGYLTEWGLIPLAPEMRMQQSENAARLEPLQL